MTVATHGLKYWFYVLLVSICTIWGDSCEASADEMVLQTVGETAEGGKLCQKSIVQDNMYTLCRIDVRQYTIKLHHQNNEGNIYGTFTALEEALSQNGETLIFAMNAGMYDQNFSPVGYYVEKGQVLKKANTKDAYGNFHLKPNGIFLIDPKGAMVMETEAFLKSGLQPVFGTQSGPMLVIDGKLHPKFLKTSSSRKRRNGVGVMPDGRTVWFAISEGKVTFHEFATLFRDHLHTPQALFLDGTISKLFATDLSRHDKGLPMGPIIGISIPDEDASKVAPDKASPGH